ncbi:sulfocyanin-like copper-binding protein [Sulfobacillus thermosulfidooxidans]|uniref:sulfocyanin-like copper-binding protein n=1 Tax=Sulfobacillus thermosulfidooxidans TaxID=28034 RepID=UPI00096B9242|nr:sulfocyanin-like copper-binding protein [Sulfobacillus thermosulfidooxidans]OLZ12144.1 hypothetical protein BFX05_00025 [Sulfobacillus thermosulfidooxidans]OLZ13076.1 hypothetical protein BFX06_11030 [Sulfobacillus thermosulfidooxidans]OLZ21456.1 hypothetical protein BFX07_11455 [Sulfobacillus thermosulfidooxidans]
MKHVTKWGAIAAIGLATVGLAGCGTAPIDASQFMQVHPASKTVDLKIIGEYSSSQQVNTFDGYTNGQLVVTIPVGYHVNMDFVNNGPIPEAIGIYKHDHLAFPNAGMPYQQVMVNPSAGLLPGQSQSFSFTATQVGTYKLGNVLNGNNNNSPTSGQWDIVKVVSSGSPSMSTT